MLTLTIRNPHGSEFACSIVDLQKGFKRLRELKRWKASVGAWVRTLEVTAPRADEFHPHFHVLMFVAPEYWDVANTLYIPHAEYRSMWQGAVGLDYEPNVYVQALDGVHEITKYM